MKEYMKWLILLCLALLIIIAGAAYAEHPVQQTEVPDAAAGDGVRHLSADLYPLYSGLTWNSESPATMQLGDQSVTGYEVASMPVRGVTDIAAVTEPFEAYYADALASAGWTEDQMLAADGAGSSMRVFTKGDAYASLMYSSAFSQGGTSSPATCPCDVTASIFSGTLAR